MTRSGPAIVLAVAVAACTLSPSISPAPPSASPASALPTPSVPTSDPPTDPPSTAPPSRTPPAASPTRPSPTTQATALPAPARDLDWGRVTADQQPDLGERGTSVFLRAVAAWDQESIVAVGELAGLGAMAWYSTNGYQWTRAESLPATRDSEMLDVRVGHTGFLAVGRNAGAAAVWLSPDGRLWTSAEVADADGVTLRGVTTWRAGFAAIGVRGDEGTETAGIWTSADGREWDMVASGSVIDGTPHAITSALDRLVVAGARLDENGEMSAGVWISDDGVEWTLATGPALESAGIRDVLSVANELVAVGYRQSEVDLRRPAAWHSLDGLNWEAFELPGATEDRDVFLTSITSGPGGYVAVGVGPNGSVGAWTTSDLLNWTLIQDVDGLDRPPDTLGRYEPSDVVSIGSQTIVVGWYPRLDTGNNRSGAVWVNPSPPEGSVPTVTHPPAQCPTGDAPDLVTLIELGAAARLDCFGDREITFTAYLDGGDGVDLTGEPAWLLGISGLLASPVEGGQFVGGAAMPLHVEPELQLDDSVFEHRWYVVTGHFDDPRAQTCRPAAGAELSVEEAISRCRQRFVVTALEPTRPPE